MTKDSAIIVVDMLYDFIDGSLACLHSEEAVAEAKKFIIKATDGQGDGDIEILDTVPVLFVCDRHPSDHSSFKEFGGIWPPHCVTGTHGSEIHESLAPFSNEELTFCKGCDREQEQYSGFEAKNSAGQSLGEVLEMLDIKETYVCGIATEYCVKNTCMDLLNAGFKVRLLSEALGFVDAQGHVEALKEMEKCGIVVE